mgnify:CR=1 FL=1
MAMYLNTIIVWALILLSNSALAEQHHEHRELGAHEHGIGSLNLVMEDKQLKVYLESPAVNLLGFEHQPHSSNEQKRLDYVLNQLKKPDQVINVEGGECRLTHYQVSNPFDQVISYESLDKQPSSDEHSDFDVEYLYTCQQPLALTSITISLFDSFNGFDSLHAQWIINSTSGAAVFDKHQNVLKVK